MHDGNFRGDGARSQLAEECFALGAALQAEDHVAGAVGWYWQAFRLSTSLPMTLQALNRLVVLDGNDEKAPGRIQAAINVVQAAPYNADAWDSLSETLTDADSGKALDSLLYALELDMIEAWSNGQFPGPLTKEVLCLPEWLQGAAGSAVVPSDATETPLIEAPRRECRCRSGPC
jgi:hypothetical protein